MILFYNRKSLLGLKPISIYKYKALSCYSKCDSRSVLEKLEDSKGEERQYLAKCLGNVVINTESLVLQWIPAHCRIEGNERADRLAKEGSVLEQIESDLTYREVKSIIKTSLNNK